MARLTEKRYYPAAGEAPAASIRDAAMALEAAEDQGASYTAYAEEVWIDEQGQEHRQPISTVWQDELTNVVEELESYIEYVSGRGESYHYPGRRVIGFTNFMIGRSSTI